MLALVLSSRDRQVDCSSLSVPISSHIVTRVVLLNLYFMVFSDDVPALVGLTFTLAVDVVIVAVFVVSLLVTSVALSSSL